MKARSPRRPTVPPGVVLAYDNAAARLQDQQRRIDAVNRRVGGVIVAAVAISGFFLSSLPHHPVVRWAVIALLITVAVEGGLALRLSRWKDAPDPRAFATLANRSPERMKQIALPTLLEAYEINRAPLSDKGQIANLAAATEVVALAVLVIGRAIWG